MTKSELRKVFSKKRNALLAAEIPGLQESILKNFHQISIPSFSKVMSYAALLDRNEFDITLIEQYLLSKNKETQISWPRIREQFDMDAIGGCDEFLLNQYGIREPANGMVVDPVTLDIVLVPLLAFDQLGYRVGYGKGYYDRFLARCRKDVVKIGFSFFEAEAVIKDIDNYDVPLDLCITPLRVYEF